MGKTTFDSTGTALPRPSPSAKRPNNSASTPSSKRGKVANFHSDDEHDDQVEDELPRGGWGGSASSAVGAKRGAKGRKVLTIADKNRLREEAERLRQGREKLPVSQGK